VSQSNLNDYESNEYAKSYIIYGDQSKAFRTAFPNTKASLDSVNQMASKAHKQLKVQSRMCELRKELKKQPETDFHVSANKIKKLLLKATKGGLKEKIDAQGNKVFHSISGAVAAMAELNRMDGNHFADASSKNTETAQPVTVNIGIVDASKK